jgi:hypothetical protein
MFRGSGPIVRGAEGKSSVTRKYRDRRGTGVTTSRAEARANRKLQLIVSNSHPGERGMTLMEKSEALLDKTMQERSKRADEFGAKTKISKDEEVEYVDWMLRNEGEIRGMLKQLAIWRSTSMKIELSRAKARTAKWKEQR